MALVPVNHDPFAGAVTPIDDALSQASFVDRLRAQHLARDDALPLVGAKKAIELPPHIQNEQDLQALVNRYADLAMQGRQWRDWYPRSGQAILAAAGGDPDIADKFAAAAARTSPGTDVLSNTRHAITLHNQAMVGDPLVAGRFPNDMGSSVERYYYGGQPIRGEKIKPFMGGVISEWNPNFHEHHFVNDIWNMRALEYPPKGGYQSGAAGQYTGSPTGGQHNFARIVANLAGDEMRRRTGEEWAPKQTQAASWVAIKARDEGIPLEQAAGDFADGLARNYAHLSWESAPGLDTNHMPEFHDADAATRQAYHDAIRSVLTDDQGRDLIARHLGLLTGASYDAPGVYKGRVNPGTQALAAVGMAPGGVAAGGDLDPASRDLANTSEAVRGLLLRQDAAAWHRPAYQKDMSLKDANLSDIRMGRPLTLDEATAITKDMHDRTGSDFFSPIGTPDGYRFLNVPAVSGLNNQQFQTHVRNLVASDLHPETGNVNLVHARADSGYIKNNWHENPNGENYLRAISGTGRPDLQRAAAELLATLGPRVAEVEERFARDHGWTPDRGTRIWETSPVIRQHDQSAVAFPSPPRPWEQRPAARDSPFFFPGAGPSAVDRALAALSNAGLARPTPVSAPIAPPIASSGLGSLAAIAPNPNPTSPNLSSGLGLGSPP